MNDNVFIVDADAPPQKPYTYQGFPKMMHHPSGDTKRARVVHDEPGVRAALAEGYLAKPAPPQEPAEEGSGESFAAGQFEELDERLSELEAVKDEIEAGAELLRNAMTELTARVTALEAKKK